MNEADKLKLIKQVTYEVLSRLTLSAAEREEVTSICTLVVLTEIKNCEASGKLPSTRYLCLWAYQNAVRWLKAEKNARHQQLTADTPEPSSGGGSGVTPLELADAVQKLPDRQRQLIRLRYTEGLKLREVAEQTGLTTSFVAHELKRAEKALKNLLGGE